MDDTPNVPTDYPTEQSARTGVKTPQPPFPTVTTPNTLADFPPDRFRIGAHCRDCGHSARVDTRRLPLTLPMETLHARLYCRECGGRGVGVTIGYYVADGGTGVEAELAPGLRR